MPIISPKTYNAFIEELSDLVYHAVRKEGHYQIALNSDGKLDVEYPVVNTRHVIMCGSDLGCFMEYALNLTFSDTPAKKHTERRSEFEEEIRSCYEHYRKYCWELNNGIKGTDPLDTTDMAVRVTEHTDIYGNPKN